MGFTRATVAGLLVGAAMASPHYGYGNGTQYTTEVVTAYTTYCPAPTTLTYQDKTYTITEATTLTITDCPCTITKPVITTSAVVCHDCPKPPPAKGGNSTLVPVHPTGEAGKPTQPEGPAATPTGEAPEEVPTAGAGKVAALSGAGLAAIVGLAAFL